MSVFQRLVSSLFIVCVLLLPMNMNGQNLVPNPSFEQKYKCPTDFVSFFREMYVSEWASPSTGTPDYFHACANKCGIPHNWVGSAEAFHGEAYMGLIACMQYNEFQMPYREYLIVKLQDSLHRGQTYYVSMHVRLGLSCIASCNGLGVYFSTDELHSDRNTVLPFKPDITFSDNEAPLNKNEWIKVCGTYTAYGSEHYIIIGNFLSNKQIKYHEFDANLIVTANVSPMAYFYIDNVLVSLVNDSVSYDCKAMQAQELAKFDGELPNKGAMVLSNLYFDFDKDVIKENSYSELLILASELIKRSDVRIQITGHTDNRGVESYNKLLSKKRALAVKLFLVEQGVVAERIVAVGVGSSEPIVSNITDDGRIVNRRVVFKIID